MNPLQRGLTAWQAARQLGWREVLWYARYQLALRSGAVRRVGPVAPTGPVNWQAMRLPPPETVRALLSPAQMATLQEQAEEITAGQVRLFGGLPRPLQLRVLGKLRHWTQHDTAATLQAMNLPDVKFLWEPARFGFTFTLGRAGRLKADPKYAREFWVAAETFWDANPPGYGPNWASAQEVALRLMALAWGGACFRHSPESTPERMTRLAASLAEHAARIPPTLAYARAQNNNHLLSEAAGLLTAAALLPEHPQAKRWQALGRKWWRWGLRHQIFEHGAYIQHSTNYHRLMLQLCLWVNWLTPQAFTSQERAQVGRAVRWLYALCDPHSGGVPNLGPNDGAYLFPLSACPFGDYRPVLQAAGRAFLGQDLFPRGAWDEMSLWFGLSPAPSKPLSMTENQENTGTAYLRAAKFTFRPGHADQLHLDLWYAGRNILLDPGTYLYNAPPPWDNALTHAAVHNTLTVDGADQMRRAGKFLYLDWAQAEITERQPAPDGRWQRITARHDGYRKYGLTHQRTVTAFEDGRWVVEDQVLGSGAAAHTYRLHYLIADGDWQIEAHAGWRLCVRLPEGGPTLWLAIQLPGQTGAEISLVRAGELLYGREEVSPIRGWVSPTYGLKHPALSLAVQVSAPPPVRFVTEIMLENGEKRPRTRLQLM